MSRIKEIEKRLAEDRDGLPVECFINRAELVQLLDRIKKAECLLEAVARRHAWVAEIGECVCYPHRDARAYFEEFTS